MANLGCVLECTFANFLGPVLVAVHTANKLDLSPEQYFGSLAAQNEQNECYESD